MVAALLNVPKLPTHVLAKHAKHDQVQTLLRGNTSATPQERMETRVTRTKVILLWYKVFYSVCQLQLLSVSIPFHGGLQLEIWEAHQVVRLKIS
jgi:hypothetical protein